MRGGGTWSRWVTAARFTQWGGTCILEKAQLDLVFSTKLSYIEVSEVLGYSLACMMVLAS